MKKEKIYMTGEEVFSGLLPSPGEVFVTCDGCGPRRDGTTLYMGTGVSLFDEELNVVNSWSFKHYSPYSTAPMSEFLAIRDALIVCMSLSPRSERIAIWSDNIYAVRAFNGLDAIRLPHLLPIKREWQELLEGLLWNVSMHWIPSTNNHAADLASRRVTEFLSEGT